MSDPRTAILAHGKNWEVPVPPDPRDIELSIESRMTAEAAGVLLQRGAGDLIIFSGGHTAGREYPTEAAKMFEAMRGQFSEEEVPSTAIKLEQESLDTAGNLREIQERLPGYEVDRLVLVTVGYHLPRVRRLARLLDLPVAAAFKSDQVIRERHGGQNHLYARTVLGETADRRSARPLVRAVTAYGIEAAGWGVSVVDPHNRHIGKKAISGLRHSA
jgi:uncharacterized SAM-binding protein YcdF (DUF218 family)